jgi:seryl-tRNA synthetase
MTNEELINEIKKINEKLDNLKKQLEDMEKRLHTAIVVHG